jgi:taurine dioxygenase
MAERSFSVKPLTPAIGAEVSGIDLGQPLSEDIAEVIYRALLDHLVIFFRDQELTPKQHLAFAKCFGELDRPHPVYAKVPGFDQIVRLANDADNPPDTDGWHTDVTFQAEPPFASILVARELPVCGGDTLWASMYAAYDSLPDEMKAMLEPMRAVHDMGDFRNDFSNREEDDGTRLLEGMKDFGCAIHPVVQRHPVTGRKFLFVNEGFTVHVAGLTARASRRLLNYLLDHINRPEHQLRFSWREGSVAMWDNRCTQHYAVADYLPAPRCMHRITIIRDRRVG